MFVPWENFLSEVSGDINDIWERQKQILPQRLGAIAGNIQLLRRSAEDAKRDARQWAAECGEADPLADPMEFMPSEGEQEMRPGAVYRADRAGSTARLIDVLRNTVGADQITAGSSEVKAMVQRLCDFQEVTFGSLVELPPTVVREQGNMMASVLSGEPTGGQLPEQRQVKMIKSQQASASRERERMIQGIQEHAYPNADTYSSAAYCVSNGFGEDELNVVPASPGAEVQGNGPSATLQFGPSTSFDEAGKQVAELLTLNRRQSAALWLLCRHLDRVHRLEKDLPQLCQFVGGEGGTGKSRIIEAVIALFAGKGMLHRLLVTATSGTAAARINGITIHAACSVSVDGSRTACKGEPAQARKTSPTSLRVDGQSRMDWLDKYMLIVDEVSMLGAKTFDAVNEQLCKFRGCTQDFGGIPVILFLGDFRQFRPVQERSVLVPSSDFLWDEGKTFRVEQRYQHDKAHALWKRFTTVVMLNEQVRAASDVQLQRLLTRIRKGVADKSDVDLLNSICYRDGRRIPWDAGITVVTPLNRNRWNLNIEATLAFQKQRQAQLRIFISEHRWKGSQPSEEEALMILGYGDDSSVPIPAVFMFVPGMPIVVNRNTYQGLKLVNGSSYTALEVIIDKEYPGHRVSADTILHFGPPAGIILAAESTKGFKFVCMPPGTVLLAPLSSKIECARRRPWQQHDVTRRGLPCTAASLVQTTRYRVELWSKLRWSCEVRARYTPADK